MLKRWIAGALAAFNVLNGATMWVDGPRWYASVPGVMHTGPYNPHFVADIGAAFLASGLALGSRAWRESYWPAALAGALFLVLHALIHLADIVGGRDRVIASDVALVILPAALALWAARPTKGKTHA